MKTCFDFIQTLAAIYARPKQHTTNERWTLERIADRVSKEALSHPQFGKLLKREQFAIRQANTALFNQLLFGDLEYIHMIDGKAYAIRGDSQHYPYYGDYNGKRPSHNAYAWKHNGQMASDWKAID